MNFGFLVPIFVLGLSAGSFLNNWICRMEENKSVLKGRSYCPKCRNVLSWKDLIPLLSFVFLRGRCRYCKEGISLQYPLVEILTAAIFVIIFNFQLSIINEF